MRLIQPEAFCWTIFADCLKGYGKSLRHIRHLVVVGGGLDRKCLRDFRAELVNVLNECEPRPNTEFCIAIEEMEAWFPGDIEAIKRAYPKARHDVLHGYRHDSICGTWEVLAECVYPGGVAALKKKGWQTIGQEKKLWVQKICPEMDTSNNSSPSFNRFRNVILQAGARPAA